MFLKRHENFSQSARRLGLDDEAFWKMFLQEMFPYTCHACELAKISQTESKNCLCIRQLSKTRDSILALFAHRT